MSTALRLGLVFQNKVVDSPAVVFALAQTGGFGQPNATW
jgi:hypothetical protein